MGSQNKTMTQTTDLIDGVTPCSKEAEVKGGSPSLGGNISDRQSEQSSWHSNQMRVSQESGQSGKTRRGFWVKVNLPTFKDEKAKDSVTYHLWQWVLSMFCHSGLDDCHMLPCVFRNFQGFLGDLVRSLVEDVTLGNVLQTLDEHYGVVMTFDTLSKEFYSLRQGIGENVAKFRVCLSQQVQILQMLYPGRIQQKHMEEVKWGHFYKSLSPKYRQMLAHKVDGKTLSPTLSSAGCLETGKVGRSQRPLAPKHHHCWECEHNSFSITRKTISLQELVG